MQGSRRKENQINVWVFAVLIVFIFLIDRILKFIIFGKFAIGTSFPILEGILHITPIHNKGIAFGLFKGCSNAIFVTITFVATIFIAYGVFFKKPKHKILTTGLSFMLAGAVSNLIDRIMYGFVLDFIDIRVWPIFNIADSAITVGAFLILIYLFKTKKSGDILQ